MARVFISHCSKDRSFARRVAEDLSSLGHDPWLDEWEITVGECIVSKVDRGLRKSEYVVVVLSNQSVNSGWVDREWKTKYWDEIQQRRALVLPALLEPCEIPASLSTKKYADFRGNYALGLVRLAQALAPIKGFQFRAFSSGTEFDSYLDSRWREAMVVRAVHFSSKTLVCDSNNRYYVECLDRFIRSGGIYHRVFVDTTESDVFLDVRNTLRKHKDSRVYAYFLDKMKVEGLRALKIMIIDEDEVCFGGGHDNPFVHNTVSIRHSQTVKFFLDYFNFLIGQARAVDLDSDIFARRIAAIDDEKQ